MGHQTITAEAAAPRPTINAPLLREVLAHIEANPKTWVQKEWRCQTGMCFAGWAAELSGGQWLTGPDHAGNIYLAAEPGDDPEEVRERGTLGQGIDAEDRATRLLGLDVRQASVLFDGSNTLDRIRAHVTVLIAQVHHVSIRVVPDDELLIGEALPDGRAPLEVVEHRPGDQPMFHGGERGIAAHRLRAHARVVADRLGVPYVDPVDPAAMDRLTRAEAA